MRKLYATVYILTAVFVLSCASKKDERHEHSHDATAGEKNWNEMDEFHMVMAEIFHPYKDSSDLEPVKNRAGELVTAADRWASSTLPPKVDHDEIRTKLQQLKSDAGTLAQNVRTADDDVIAAQLIKVHDTFHEIQEAWYGGH